MPKMKSIVSAGGFLAAFGALASAASAQVTDDNAVTDATDAFGTNVGLESTGIYSERDTRGFSPQDAGNVRIDGILFDQVTNLSSKLRDYTAIRVGFSAVDTPFVAPTGVVDHQLRPFPEKFGASVTYNRFYYGGHFSEADVRGTLLQNRVGLQAGIGISKLGQADGSDSDSWGLTGRAFFRFGGFEFSPFFAGGDREMVFWCFKMRRNIEAHLGEWIPEPTVQTKVINYIDQLNAPFILGEIWRPLGIRRMAAHRVLTRLIRKGFLTRYKITIPIKQYVGISGGREVTINREMYLYQLAETSE